MPNMVSIMRQQIERTGSSKADIFYVKSGDRKRIRFLKDAENAMQVQWHDKFGDGGHNTPCLKHYGKPCPYCKMTRDETRTKPMFAWPVYSYADNAVQLFMYRATTHSPINQLLAAYEDKGTLVDRDYTVARNGEGLDTNYNVIGQDREEFKLKGKVTIPSDEEMLKIIANAFDVPSGAGAADADDDFFES